MLRIKEVAKQKGLTLTEVADKMGITRISLSKTINGNPTIETLSKIAEILSVHITDLFEPNTEDFATLYRQNDNGEYIEIGQIRKDKE